MLLSFPNLHPEMWSGGPVEGLRFFDPGLSEASFDGAFRPENLPLDSRTATSLISDCIRFGEQFKDPGEMAYFGAVTADDFYEGSSMSIQAQLERQFAGIQSSDEERSDQEARSKAQFVLLLAWFLEERMIEMAGLEQGVKSSWQSMDTTLGVDEDDRLENGVESLGKAESHTGGSSGEQRIAFPWQRVIEAVPIFLPEGSVLVCADVEVLEAWEEYGIEFTDEVNGMPAATLPAWKFAGRRKEPEGMVATLRDVTVAVIR